MIRMHNSTRAAQKVSAAEPDWMRERPIKWWDPSRRLLATIRAWQSASRGKGIWGAVRRKYWAWSHGLWQVVCGASIPLSTKIDGGLLLPHPVGVVVHPDTVIGPNCLIMQNVTLGVNGKTLGAPKLGGHVDLSAGACVLGPIEIGDHARIGANAVVLTDVPPGATAVGVPARIVKCSREAEATSA